jgi:hypothetical protein
METRESTACTSKSALSDLLKRLVPASFEQHASSQSDTSLEEDHAMAAALAAEFEQLRQTEEADADLAASMAAGLGTLHGHLPGQEPPSTKAVRSAQPQHTVAMYDSQVRSCAASLRMSAGSCGVWHG